MAVDQVTLDTLGSRRRLADNRLSRRCSRERLAAPTPGQPQLDHPENLFSGESVGTTTARRLGPSFCTPSIWHRRGAVIVRPARERRGSHPACQARTSSSRRREESASSIAGQRVASPPPRPNDIPAPFAPWSDGGYRGISPGCALTTCECRSLWCSFRRPSPRHRFDNMAQKLAAGSWSWLNFTAVQ